VSEQEAGGRVFFSSVRRSLEIEDEINLLSVGVDIGSSTSHLVFSRLLLERLDNRYIVSRREIVHQSDVLLTPYADDLAIDAAALGGFIERQYDAAGISPETIDTGALILTGVAVRRRNARAIGDLFAAQAGKFVSVSAGDALEATLAAFGSGAAARSIRETARVMNLDIGGGTSKIALCEQGAVVEMTAMDVGARVLAFDRNRRLIRIEEAGRVFAREAGAPVALGAVIDESALDEIAGRMADRLFEVVSARALSPESRALLRLDPLHNDHPPDIVMFSGGVSEYVYGHERQEFGDLGPRLARRIHDRVATWGPRIEAPDQGIRATVVGASQYTIQVSGSTIFVYPLDTLPVRNVPVIAPELPLSSERLDAEAIARAVGTALRRLDLQGGDRAVAVCYRWHGAATFDRLDVLVRGLAQGLASILATGLPLILVGDGDVGGLVGIHACEEARLPNPIVSIDGITLKEFDFIDIGAILELSGAVPVVIKSLVFPTAATVGAQR
jgi:ethanolamine utilization protein EutA (predicted chaperonin)